jgi:hypothetical protein
MDGRQGEIFQKVKDRFLAACREATLLRLNAMHEQHPGIDVDLFMELVILTGLGYLAHMREEGGTELVDEFLNDLLQKLTITVCDLDPELLEDIHQILKSLVGLIREKKSESEEEESGSKVKVEAQVPIPGMGLFGFRPPNGGN